MRKALLVFMVVALVVGGAAFAALANGHGDDNEGHGHGNGHGNGDDDGHGHGHGHAEPCAGGLLLDLGALGHVCLLGSPP